MFAACVACTAYTNVAGDVAVHVADAVDVHVAVTAAVYGGAWC